MGRTRGARRGAAVWGALRYRWVQGVVIALLAGLVTGCVVFAPLYDRGLQQAMVKTQLAAARPDVSGLGVTSVAPSLRFRALSPEQMVAEVPAVVRRHMEKPITSISVDVGVRPFQGDSPTGALVARSGACAHVDITDGRCPRARNEIVISAADAKNFGWRTGDRIRVAEVGHEVDPAKMPHKTLHVVGVYTPVPGRYWFGLPPTGRSGFTDPQTEHPQHDWWLTDRATMVGKPPRYGHPDPADSWLLKTNTADFLIDAQSVGIDELLAMKKPLQDYLPKPYPSAGGVEGPVARARTGLVDLATAAAHGRDQAHTTVPLFMVQVGLLAALALWLVLTGALQQRRPEVAVARLRGRGPAGSRRLLLMDLGPILAAGFVAGVAAAFGLSWIARRTWLAPGVPFELRWPVLYAVLAAGVVLVGMVLIAVRSTTSTPLAGLLRRIPPRRAGWMPHVGELLVIVLAGSAFAAIVSGSLTGPVAMAAPSVLALAIGLVTAHLLGPMSRAVAGRFLAHGRLSGGLSLLQIIRRPETRVVIATITVATALLVFAVDALVVGSHNRTIRAQAETGAAAVSTVRSTDVAAVQRIVHQVDPSGREVTPVVMLSSLNQAGTSTVAVDPQSFRRVALFPGIDSSSVPWASLRADQTMPRVTGTQLTARVSASRLRSGDEPASVEVRAHLVDENSQKHIVSLGRVTGDTTRDLHADVSCSSDCILTGLAFLPTGDHKVRGAVTVDRMTSSGHPVRLGPANQWRDTTQGYRAGKVSISTRGPGHLTFDLTLPNAATVTATSPAIPARFPALVAGGQPADAHGRHFRAQGLDGVRVPMTRTGTLPYVPGAPPRSVLVNVHSLQRLGVTPDSTLQLQVWFADHDPALIHRVTRALHRHDIPVIQTTTTDEAQHAYTQTAATWGLQLGAVVGAAAAAIAALVLLIAVATSWRIRSHDYAALRMSGLSQRTVTAASVGEILPAVVLSVILGTLCALAGGHYALPKVPLFATPPDIPVLDLSPVWPAITWALVGGLGTLGLTAVLTGVFVARRAALSRLRETL